MISISILDCDLLNMEDTLLTLKRDGITNIHLDILDTSFVPNISFGPSFINRILKHNFIFEVHLMVNDSLKIIKLLDIQKIDVVYIHFESKNKKEAIKYIRSKNVKVGLAINPDTDIQEVVCNEIFNNISRLLIMTVYPGFGNQKFIESSSEKIKYIKNKIMVGVDGGINLDTVHKVRDFDFIVIGSAYFKSEKRQEFIKEINKKLGGI